MRILESGLERNVVRLAREHGLLYLKVTPQGRRGWPDRLFINATGQHLYLELKRPGEKPRKLQEHILGELRKRGVRAEWTDNFNRAKQLLAAHSAGSLDPPCLSAAGAAEDDETSSGGTATGSGSRKNIDLLSRL